MDYERRCEELVEAIKLLQETNPSDDGIQNWANDVLYGTKEANDGRIRKALIRFFEAFPYERLELSGVSAKEAIAWIKKQGEHKSCNSIELNFKVGDWIIFAENHYSIYQVEKIDNYRYYLRHYLGGTLSVHFDNELIRRWTIADAKDGDVLVNGSNIFIFHFINDTRLMGYCHVNTDDGRFYDDIGKNECFCLIDAIVTPATKEQRDTLFTKMKEAGYEWNAEKKELNKIAENEDEKVRKAQLDYWCSVGGKRWHGVPVQETIAWLEKQDEKLKKVPIWKHWKDGIAGGEEGKQIYLIKNGLTYSISSCLGQECDYIELSELDKLMREEKPKWTEEDEYHWTICLECVEECATQINTDFSKTIQWLQSLKQRIVQ